MGIPAFCIPIHCYGLQASRQRLINSPLCRFKMTTAVQNTNEERFDILTENGSPKGFSKPRSQVHRDGDWHRSTHIWVLASDRRVLVQKRAVGKDTFPGLWDVSAAGHISAGDKSSPAARRELEEELGIALKDEKDMQFVMSVKATATGRTDRHGEYTDNEIQDIYVYDPKKTVPFTELILQEDEVESVEYWQWDDYCKRCNDGDETVVPRSELYRHEFFPWLSNYFQKVQ